MKKVTKLFALIIAILMMCLCLSGCDELDQMRKEHAKWTTAGDISSLQYDDNTYLLIDIDTTELYTMYDSKEFLTANVTNPDAPVLLSSSFGDILDVSDDKIFIQGFVYDDPYKESITGYTGEYKELLYCREDMYDEISKIIEDGIEYTKYGYGYWTYDEDDAESYGYEEYEDDEYLYYHLSQKECDAINEIIKTTEPLTDAENPYDDYYIVMLDKISDDEYFAKESYEIYTDGLGNYSLNLYSYVLDSYTTYIVDEKYNDIMDGMVKNVKKDYMYYEY